MFLTHLHATNFKIYEQVDANFSHKIVCFAGPNGSGKTNLLDAIHYLCIGKSYFNSTDYQNVRYGQDFFRVVGKFDLDSEVETISCVVEKGNKKMLKRNKVEYDKISDHIGHFPVVVIAPDDLELVNGGSEGRRKFLDFILSFSNRNYLEALMDYNRLISQRNALLRRFWEERRFNYMLMESIDDQLIPKAVFINEARQGFMKHFEKLFKEYYNTISGGGEKAAVKYQSDLSKEPYHELLEKNLERDRMLQRTDVGIHKDDLTLKLNDYVVKRYGSQGQKKSFLLALKLSKYHYLREKLGIKPLLLLDDLFDKLDPERAHQLVKLTASDDFGQIFITDTQPERLKETFKPLDLKIDLYRVDRGAIAPDPAG